MKKFLLPIIIIGVLGLILAVQISTTFGGVSSENITFTGDENYTRNITIYRYANITSAYINLSGYNVVDLNVNSTDDTEDDADISQVDGTVVDENWSSGFIQGGGSYTVKTFWVNYTYDTNWENSNLSLHFKTYHNPATGSYPSTIYMWNYTLNNFQQFAKPAHYGGGGIEYYYTIHNDYFVGNKDIQMYINVAGGGVFSWDGFYEEELLWYGKNYTNNSFVSVNNTQIWNHTGEFNSTYSPNKTSDFRATLNSALNNGQCNCTGCELSGKDCIINFTFHSDTTGVLEYSAIDIDYLEYDAPNLTIYAPNLITTSKTINYNVNVTENNEIDKCFLWVTRGASLEIANTSVTCNLTANATGSLTVSGDANFWFHFWVNDTSGNTNYSNSSFNVSGTGDVAGVSTGGGGGIRIMDILENPADVSFCLGTDTTFLTYWRAWTTDLGNWNKFKVMWFALWNHSFCVSTASLVPLESS